MTRQLSWLLLALFPLALVAHAADVPAPLTEADAVRIALQQSPMVREAEAEAGMAQARVGMARSEAKWQVSANGTVSASNMRNVVPIPGVMPTPYLQTQERASVGLNATAMLPLYTGGRITYAVRSAQLGADAVTSEVALTRTKVAAEARMRYADLQQALAMERVAQDAVKAEERAAQTAQQLFDVGKAPRFDVARAQAALAAAKQDLANAQADIAAARARLAQVLGVDAGTLGDPIDGAPVAAPTDTLATALQRRADLRAAEQRMLAATAGVQARKAEYRPQVYAFGMTDFGAPGGAGYTLGVGAGIPVVDGGRRKAQLAEAGQAVSQAQAARDTVMLQVKADVAGAEARVVAARQNIDTAGTQVTAAQEAFDVSSVRYGAGKGTIVELLDSQRALTDARQSLAIAQARYRSALAELYQAMGLETIPAA